MKIVDAVFVYHLVEHERVACRYHTHERDEYEIHFFLDGNGMFLCSKIRYDILPEKFFITVPGEFHSIIPNMTPISYYAILFRCEESDTELRRLLDEVAEKKPEKLL